MTLGKHASTATNFLRQEVQRPNCVFMSTTSTESESTVNLSGDTRQQLLEHARNLDRFGRRAEDFLCRKFQQLEREIDEFEREKAAWRRQLRRESSQLVRQREELEQRDSERSLNKSVIRSASDRLQRTAEAAAAKARASGRCAIRLLLGPHEATSMQVGLLMFEMSKLNRDMGGRGLRFQVAEVRMPRRRLFWRHRTVATTGRILEITVSSMLPLMPRGSHVSLDVDATDRIEHWIAFKTRLLQSCLVKSDLLAEFNRGKRVGDNDSCSIIREATRHVAAASSQSSDYSSASQFANTPIDSVQQQLDRLESCYESIKKDSGLLVHIELGNRDDV